MQDYGREGTICLSLAPEVDGSGVSYPLWQLDYFYAIHFAETRPVVQITYDGEIYKMNLKYYIFDYYDWDENGDVRISFVSDQEMYYLCRCGVAKFYENWGIYETEIEWKIEDYPDMTYSEIASELVTELLNELELKSSLILPGDAYVPF